MPQKAREGYILHVMANAFAFEMPLNRTVDDLKMSHFKKKFYILFGVFQVAYRLFYSFFFILNSSL